MDQNLSYNPEDLLSVPSSYSTFPDNGALSTTIKVEPGSDFVPWNMQPLEDSDLVELGFSSESPFSTPDRGLCNDGIFSTYSGVSTSIGCKMEVQGLMEPRVSAATVSTDYAAGAKPSEATFSSELIPYIKEEQLVTCREHDSNQMLWQLLDDMSEIVEVNRVTCNASHSEGHDSLGPSNDHCQPVYHELQCPPKIQKVPAYDGQMVVAGPSSDPEPAGQMVYGQFQYCSLKEDDERSLSTTLTVPTGMSSNESMPQLDAITDCGGSAAGLNSATCNSIESSQLLPGMPFDGQTKVMQKEESEKAELSPPVLSSPEVVMKVRNQPVMDDPIGPYSDAMGITKSYFKSNPCPPPHLKKPANFITNGLVAELYTYIRTSVKSSQSDKQLLLCTLKDFFDLPPFNIAKATEHIFKKRISPMLLSRAKFDNKNKLFKATIAQLRSGLRAVPSQEAEEGTLPRRRSSTALLEFDRKIFIVLTSAESAAFTSHSERERARTTRSSRASLQGVVNKTSPLPQPKPQTPASQKRPATLGQRLSDLESRYTRRSRAQSKLINALMNKVAIQERQLSELRKLVVHRLPAAKRSSKSSAEGSK